MNFADLQFWTTLVSALSGWLLLRRLAGTRWPAWGDAVSLLLTSLWLFQKASGTSFLLFVCALAVNSTLARVMTWSSPGARGWLLALGVLGNLAVLAYFKYARFIVEDVLRPLMPGPVLSTPARFEAIPPGISFYTFQMIGFLIDVYRAERAGRAEAPRRLDFFNFVAFFPQIVAGPIERRADLLPQITGFQWRVDGERMAEALRWCILGLFTKMVLADSIAPFVKDGATSNGYAVVLSVSLFGLRIYFDFAGYSFIAIGLGRFFGISLTDNFRAPYTARSVREFWRRWHITLSTWFRDYLYVPLGGGKGRFVALNLLLVFFMSGLWHGASWNFVLWGVYHGLLVVAQHWLGGRVSLPPALARAGTLLLVFVGWLLFMNTNLATLKADLVTLSNPAAFETGLLMQALPSAATDRGALGLVLALAAAFLLAEDRDAPVPYRQHLRPVFLLAMIPFIVLCVGRRTSEFIYFAF